jgi:uncharacterized protein YbaR (Trm112 family)
MYSPAGKRTIVAVCRFRQQGRSSTAACLIQYRQIYNPDRNMPVNGKLLEILCCPVSKTPLTVLGRQKLEKLNKAIENGEALYVGGEKVTQPLQEGLITEDGKVIYPVQDDIPILLEEKGIGTTQFQDF